MVFYILHSTLYIQHSTFNILFLFPSQNTNTIRVPGVSLHTQIFNIFKDDKNISDNILIIFRKSMVFFKLARSVTANIRKYYDIQFRFFRKIISSYF